MRRIASALAGRRSDRPEDPNTIGNGQHPPPSNSSPSLSSHPRRKSSRRFFGTLTRITVSTERSTQPSEPVHSSSASSTGSVSLRTPEDDRMGHLAPPVGRSPSGRRAWIPWLAPKKSDLQNSSRPPSSSYWSDSLSSVRSPTSFPVPPKIISGQPTASDEDTSDESLSSESDAPSHSPSLLTPPGSASLNRQLAPVDFLKTLTTNNISPPFSPPPLLHHPNAPVFPRSSHRLRSPPFRDSMESAMHKIRLFHRLQRGHFTPTDQRLLASIGSRTSSVAQRRTLIQPEEGERYDLKHVRSSSLGLKQWITRPYFEERSVVWVPDETGTVVWTTIEGSGFGVWALEVSETLELMAELTDVEDPHPIGTFATRPPISPPGSSASLSAVGKHVPYKAVPSPLRSDHTSDPPMSSSTEVTTSTSASTVLPSRRGVRFAENIDKEDQVPLSYVLRHRKRREEKALFLQREQERRKHEEERLRHEAERQQWEQEKRQWQKEKRTVDEARRQKQFAEEIAAARVRRESLYALPSSQTREQDRKAREAYSRPSYDLRRQTEPSSRPPRSRNDSSSSSMQGSLAPSEAAGPLASRPPSAYSVASSDTRGGRNNNKRASIVSESSQRSFNTPIFTYGWQPVPPMPQMLPVPGFSSIQAMPAMPQFPVDMPLLPPTAPFMRQQYGRSRERGPSHSRGTGQSRSAERPQHLTDRSSPSRHHRSSSDEHGGHKSPAHSHAETNNHLVPTRPAYLMQSRSADASHRLSVASSLHKKPYAPRRQTAIS